MIKSIISLVFLLLPNAVVVFRYELLAVHTQTILNLITAFIFLIIYAPLGKKGENGQERIFGIAFFHIKEIIWDFWEKDYEEIHFEEKLNTKHRAKHYIDFRQILTFQSTLSCTYLDSQAALKLIPEDWNPAPIKILDIGGGDGKFTSYLVQGLAKRGLNIGNILHLDPGDWSDKYKSNLRVVINLEQIAFKRSKFSLFQSKEKYELIIASHSLYSECDSHQKKHEVIKDAITKPLFAFLETGGILLIILASNKGVSYTFKNLALEFLLNSKVEDTTAESFMPALEAWKNETKFFYNDSIFNMSELLNSYDLGNASPIKNWLSYFLRYDFNKLNHSQLKSIVALLRSHTVRFSELSEEQIAHHKKVPHFDISDDSLVLPHKTVVIVCYT